MASELFYDLYKAAKTRDHYDLQTAQDVWAGLRLNDLPACMRLAKALNGAHAECHEELLAKAMRNRMRVLDTRPKCPGCGDPECPGSAMSGELVVLLGKAAIQKFFHPDK